MRRDLFLRYGQRVLAGAVLAMAAVTWGELFTDAQAWRVSRAAVFLAGGPAMVLYGVLLARDWRGVTRELVERERSRSRSDNADAERRYGTLRAAGWGYAVGGLAVTMGGVLLLLDLIMT